MVGINRFGSTWRTLHWKVWKQMTGRRCIRNDILPINVKEWGLPMPKSISSEASLAKICMNIKMDFGYSKESAEKEMLKAPEAASELCSIYGELNHVIRRHNGSFSSWTLNNVYLLLCRITIPRDSIVRQVRFTKAWNSWGKGLTWFSVFRQ